MRGTALATLAMTAVVLAVKLLLYGVLRPTPLLLVEVVAGAVTFLLAMWLLDRRLLLEMWRITRQSVPGLRRFSGVLPRGRPRALAEASREPAAEAKADPLSPSIRGDE
jgi:hypothetical protein